MNPTKLIFFLTPSNFSPSLLVRQLCVWELLHIFEFANITLCLCCRITLISILLLYYLAQVLGSQQITANYEAQSVKVNLPLEIAHPPLPLVLAANRYGAGTFCRVQGEAKLMKRIGTQEK